MLVLGSLLLLASLSCDLVLSERSINVLGQCRETCQALFHQTNKREGQVNSPLTACQHGCDSYPTSRDAKDGVNMRFDVDTYYGDAQKKCDFGCDQSFPDLRAACRSGCDGYRRAMSLHDVTDVHDDIPTLFSRLDDFFQSPFQSLFSREPLFRRMPDGIFGRKDDDRDPFSSHDGIFNNLHKQMTKMMNSIPFEFKFDTFPRWSPQDQEGGGQMTVISAGPGYREEKHYKIGNDGHVVEVPNSMTHDALMHKNPLDQSFNFDEVEILPQQPKPFQEEERLSVSRKQLEKEEKEVERFFDVDDFVKPIFNDVNEKVHDTDIEYQRASDYVDEVKLTCSGGNTKWSDWVACIHDKVGIPRWLTAATISLGIVFSIWLCLVIPSAAPKQRVKASVVDTTTAAAKAKEAEAMMISTVTTADNLEKGLAPPPSYQEVTGLGLTVKLEPVHSPTTTVISGEKKEEEESNA